MCGIAGIHFKHDVDAGVLDRASAHFGASLQHRGPDHFGVHRTARAVYVNLRLAIVDRSGGQQPIYAHGTHAAQGRQGIVYNGEVYNHAELRAPLEAHYPFSTKSDTEMLLATWLARREHAFEHWNGMFAACLFDDADGSFTLVRDRFGAKPLYIYEDEHCIAFASELSTLLGLEGLDHSLNPVAFQDYLAYRYNLAPYTQFKHIERLPAGCFTSWHGGQRSTTRFAEIQVQEPAQARSQADYEAELDHLLGRAVKSQLMGEVPIGVLLSGGLDSSAIASYVHAAGARLKAYSIGLREVNEFTYSRAVAKQFDLDYVELCLSQDELRSGMDAVIGKLDEPMADPACFALSRLCQRIREDVTVVLSGEGGDEMFAGYAQHALALDATLTKDSTFGRFFWRSSNDVRANELMCDKAMPLYHLRHRSIYDQADTALNGMLAFELSTWMPENLMMKADKVLMAHSLEGRFPFLDLDVYRFASTLPQAMKLPHAGSSKHVLRQLMRNRLPTSVIDRPKMGFTVPPVFFLEPMRARLEEAIHRLRHTPVAEVLDLDGVHALLERYYGGDTTLVMKLWNVAVLMLWWVDVYPTVCLKPAAAPPLALPLARPAEQPKLTIYTVLIGAKETLNDPLAELPPNARSDLALDWVCITDNKALRSNVWRMQLLQDPHLPPEKLSRRPKAMPHLYFPEAEFSLYVDNTVSFRRLPQSSDLQHGGEYLFRAFRHATRLTPEDEAGAVACLGYDSLETISAQMDFYAARRKLSSITPLTTATVLLRSHHHERVQRFGTLWWESILAFSKRDQLSIDFARIETGCEIDHWPGTSENNPFVHWHGGLGQKRVQASFDAKRYAWMHRSDAAAKADPKAHYLAHFPAHVPTLAQPFDPRFQQDMQLLEYACWRQQSSLGSQVSPRRHMAQPLEALLAPLQREGLRFLLVRVQDSQAERAFSAAEFDAATAALSMFFGKGQGTTLDLAAADFADDGKVFTTAQTPYEVVLLLGLPGERLEVATQKLVRMIDRERGSWVVALTSPAPLASAARAEALIGATLGVPVSSSVHASRHDDQRESLPNTVLGFTWAKVHVATPVQAAP